MTSSRRQLQEALQCAKCGACAAVCPVFRVDGREAMTARGRMHLLATEFAAHPSAIFEDVFSRCLLCGTCEQVCPRQLPVKGLVSRARSRFSRFYGPNGLKKAAACSALNSPLLLEGLVKTGISLRRIGRLPMHSGLRLKLGLPEERTGAGSQLPYPQFPQSFHLPQEQDSSGVSYFSGCFSRHLQPSIVPATHALLNRCALPTVHIPKEQHCCGLAAWSAGRRDQARVLARKNIQAFSGSDSPIITSCASCSSHLLSYPNLFAEHDPWYKRACAFADRVQEFTAFFHDNLPSVPSAKHRPERIFYHDPCHLRFTDNGMSAPRSLLDRMGFCRVEPEDGPHCCGQGGLFQLACPEHAERIFQKSSRRVLALRPDCITTTCSGCLMQYQEGIARQKLNIRVKHMAVLLADLLREQT